MVYNKQITKAIRFAREKHEGQLDDAGLDFFNEHVNKVGKMISITTNDSDIISAAYLHDTIEDTDTTYYELTKEFNKRVADLVMEVTFEIDNEKKIMEVEKWH